MRKNKLYLIAVSLGIVLLSCVMVIQRQRETSLPKPQQPPVGQVTNQPVIENTKLRAADVILLDDAKALIGSAAVQADTPEPSSGGLVNGMQLSLVGFQAVTGENIKNFAVALQTSMDDQAYKAYIAAQPSLRQDIANYGDTAYWAQDNRQLHIYKDGNWLKITVISIDTDYLEFAKSVADIVVPRL